MLKRKQEHYFVGTITRAKLNMTRKENKFLMQSKNSTFLLDSI